MTEVEPNSGWFSSSIPVKDSSKIKNDSLQCENRELAKDVEAPTVIFSNYIFEEDLVPVQEEVVIEDSRNGAIWLTNHAVEEVIGCSSNKSSSPGKSSDDTSEIPLNDENYVTFHPFPCDFCSRRFKKKANLINHMVSHQTQRPHGCGLCSSRFMRKCDLVNHMKIHQYVPNRNNRKDVEDETRYIYKKMAKSRRTRTESQMSSQSEGYATSEKGFKPTNYVDEDVQLLLEMTTKLHEKSNNGVNDRSSRTSEGIQPELTNLVIDERRPYMCKKCGRCFSRESALVSHSQMHRQDSTYKYLAKKHGGDFSSSDNEDDGEESPYTGDERFVASRKVNNASSDYSPLFECSNCSMMFITQEKLQEHVDKSHSSRQHPCRMCGSPFKTLVDLEEHVKKDHARNRPPHTCKYCGENCSNVQRLKRHLLTHVQDESFLCSFQQCGKRFQKLSELRRHELKHPTRTVSPSPKKTSLSSSPSDRRFSCHECGKVFTSRSSQQIHTRIHTGERPYGCRYCWKAFADGGTLRKHERIHTGEKPYVCVVCPRAFNQRVVLREHIRAHHSNATSHQNYATPVFLCQVCGVVTSNAEELAMHIVKHSDEKTQHSRSRPYKAVNNRKRKRKVSEEVDDYELSDEDPYLIPTDSESDWESDEDDKKNSSRAARSTPRAQNYSKLTKTMDAALKNITSLVEPVRKAKMINTTLRSTTGQSPGKRGRPRKTSIVVRPLDPESLVGQNETQRDVVVKTRGPRTKNVRSEDESSYQQYPVATFPHKKEGIEEEEVVEVNANKEVEEEQHVCGICSQRFNTKADLLYHVPIHI